MISKKIKQINLCPECGGTIISIHESGDIVCSQCGLVLDERSIDFSHNGRRAFTSQEKKQRDRTGSPISRLVPDLGLTTVINKNNINNPDLKRAAKWNTRISWEKRNLLIATTELKRICSNLNLPDYIKEEAMHLYKRAFEKKLLKGRSINGMVAACIYFSIRTKKLPRTLQEVIGEASVEAKEVRRCYSALIRELKLKVPNTDPSALVPKFIVEMGLDAEIERLTVNFLETFKSKLSTSGKDPKGIVAGALYLACKIKEKKLTQSQIAEIVGVTEVTLRSRYRELVKKLKIKI
ncbi:MAG: transcription initiation factor IIB family protein [Candidatus Hodarchaeota archaeon]